jgi:hypothetical protein
VLICNIKSEHKTSICLRFRKRYPFEQLQISLQVQVLIIYIRSTYGIAQSQVQYVVCESQHVLYVFDLLLKMSRPNVSGKRSLLHNMPSHKCKHGLIKFLQGKIQQIINFIPLIQELPFLIVRGCHTCLQSVAKIRDRVFNFPYPT